MSGRARRLLSTSLLAALCGGCGDAAATANQTSEPARAPAVIEARDAHGVAAYLAEQRGKPLLVNFWATWCGPCVAELPDLLAATRAFRADGGVVVGVAMEQMGIDSSVDEAVARAGAKAEQLGLDFVNLVCTTDEMIVVRDELGVSLGALPQTLAYDRQGQIVEQHEGKASAAQFAALAAAAAKR
ncbi:MAG: TlpA family protein disulfide reductase [Planctomycetes bacterium]|nr:TlpA family protein disulfide reductase [Planctomycetota bacterium]